jgi:hypothetical protein
MNREKAFIDTTILTDVLLKPTGQGVVAKEALKKYSKTELPVYAIKEFKAGPLKNFVWMHNKLASTKSFAQSLAALHAMSRTLKRYTTSTAIEALKEAGENLKSMTNQELVTKYGANAVTDVSLCENFRDSIEVLIMMAWKRRRKVTNSVVEPLDCYEEKEPFEKRGLLDLSPTKCKPSKECCLAPKLRDKIKDLELLYQAVKQQPESSENQKRYKILHEISRKPKQPISEEMCRGLGDAYFALFCPKDSVVLTTNLKDHKPLAKALGKDAELPES